MSVRIVLDRPHSHFTNLDFITGRIILTLTSNEQVSNIIVKLEGESKTRLSAPVAPDMVRQRDVTELEVHKMLYQVQEVFPAQVLKSQAFANGAFTLKAGQYEYPFNFKLPFNNHCSPSNSLYSNLSFTGPRIEFARDTDKHVKNILPPSLSGFPGEAEIRYYVKVTVSRPQFYRENRRAYAAFKFLPIEPPRPPSSNNETYARRSHQFQAVAPSLAPPTRKASLFSSNHTTPTTSPSPPRFTIDARFPSPPSVTCNEPLPLRLLLHTHKTPSSSSALSPVQLQILQITLIGYTTVRAHGLTRTESTSWVLLSRSNLSIPLTTGREPAETEIPIDDSMWRHLPLPNTVAPAFETCNIGRRYEVEISVGLTHGSASGKKTTMDGAKGKSPELVVLPLRLPVVVYSGIKPPAELIARINQASSSLPSDARPMAGPSVGAAAAAAGQPPPPFSTGLQSAGDAGGDLPDVAPPSYEDAMAQDLAPVDGRRRDYGDELGESRVGPSRTSADSNDGRASANVAAVGGKKKLDGRRKSAGRE